MTAPTTAARPKKQKAMKCRNCTAPLTTATEWVVRERMWWPEDPVPWKTMRNRHCERCAKDLADLHFVLSPGWEFLAVKVMP